MNVSQVRVRPQEKSFNKAKLCNKWLNRILFVAFIFSITTQSLKSIISSGFFYDISRFGSILFVFLISVLTICFSALQNVAENDRRAGLIDNVFGTKIALSQSKNYYDTDNIEKGPIKLLATIHQNCMYTNRIVERMLLKCGIKLGLMSIILLIFFFIGIANIQIFEMFLQLYLSGLFVYELIDIYNLYSTTKLIEESSREVWSSFSHNRSSIDFTAKAVHISIRYECAITRAHLIIDEKVYSRLNDEIESEWNKFRVTNNI